MPRGRRKKRISKPKAQVIEEYRDVGAEQEFLSADVDPKAMNDPVVRALIYDLPSASQAEATEIALQLQKRLRGDASLLENEAEMADVIEDIRKEAYEIDKAAEKWETDRMRFVEDVIDNAPKLSKAQEEKLQAKGQHMLSEAIKLRRAGKSTKQLQFKEYLRHAPTEDIMVTGQFVKTPDGPRHIPDVVTVLGIRFVLEPGVQTVPAPIAEAYKQMVLTRQQQAKKMALMKGEGAPTGSYEHGDMMQKIADVNRHFGSN